MATSWWQKVFGKSSRIEPPAPQAYATDAESLFAGLAKTPLAPYATALVGQARNAIHLRHASDDAKISNPARTKIGGRPDMPPDMAWPIRESFTLRTPKGFVTKLLASNPDPIISAFLTRPQPLSFLAQINLAEVAALSPPELALPQQGMLYFFYDMIYEGWGFDPNDAPGFRVIHLAKSENVAPRDPPATTPPLVTFAQVVLEPIQQFCPVPAEGMHFDALDLPSDTRETYADFLSADERVAITAQDWLHRFGGPDHRMAGYSRNIQNAMEQECALVSAGLYCGDGDVYRSDEGKRILAANNDWQLLLQIDSDDDAEMMWGDSGILYFWIRQADLRAGDFSKVWTILQCY